MVHEKYFKFRHPHSHLIVGPSGSGKTVRVRQYLKDWKLLFTNFKTDTLSVLWCYGVTQPLYSQEVSDSVEIHYHKGLVDEEFFEENQGRFHLVILDDLMEEMTKGPDAIHVRSLWTRLSHHMNISTWGIVQNLFQDGMRVISLNTHYFTLLPNVRDRRQIMVFSGQVFPTKPKYLLESFIQATEKKEFGYLLVDLKPDTPTEIRLRTRLCSDELKRDNIRGTKFAPIIYREKNG